MSKLPPDVVVLLRLHVRSFEHLEILLQLSRQPERQWTPADVAAAVGLQKSVASEVLAELLRSELIAIADSGPRGYVFAPATPELALACERLTEARSTSHLDVMHFLSANALKRVRRSAAYLLADAFVLRSDKKGEEDG